MGEVSGSGLIDYVRQSSRVLFSGNYAPEDALVFAQLSYMKFEAVYGYHYEGVPVGMAQYASQLLRRMKEDGDNRMLLKAVAESRRYQKCTLGRFAAESERSQWAAFTVHMNDYFDSAVIAMRGTDGTTLGWTEDFKLLYEEAGTQAQKLSADYLTRSPQRSLFLTGHSKGGNNVTSAFVMAEKAVEEKVVRIDNFDGPGVNEKFRERFAAGYERLSGRLSNFYPQDSVIGLLLNDNPGRIFYVRSSRAEGILHEHDPYNWMFDADGQFQYTRQSSLSKLLNETLDITVHALSQRERVMLVDVLVRSGALAAIVR
ncbi:Mbeg1-like protein [Lachnospiraceae bacterium 47-T17]